MASEKNLVVNGNGDHEFDENETPTTPSTPPRIAGLSLTEYSANPSPPLRIETQSRLREQLPEDFILPNGYPDVRISDKKEPN